MRPEFFPLGDTGVQIVFAKKISEETNYKIQLFSRQLKNALLPGVTEWIPAYVTLTVFYYPNKISYASLCDKLLALFETIKEQEERERTFVFEIPTYYGGDFGFDLSYVAERNGLEQQDVVSIHSESDYLIYMLGFAPGFPYVGGMSKRIAAPRRENPRRKIEAGSVGIAGDQTGIYSVESPGGWQIIGKTPVKLYNPANVNPFLLSPGNYIRFLSIEKNDFLEIQKAVEHGKYEVTVKEKG
jgi:inhibitor of KinA